MSVLLAIAAPDPAQVYCHLLRVLLWSSTGDLGSNLGDRLRLCHRVRTAFGVSTIDHEEVRALRFAVYATLSGPMLWQTNPSCSSIIKKHCDSSSAICPVLGTNLCCPASQSQACRSCLIIHQPHPPGLFPYRSSKLNSSASP